MKKFKLVGDCAWNRKASKLTIMFRLKSFKFSDMCRMKTHKNSGLSAE